MKKSMAISFEQKEWSTEEYELRDGNPEYTGRICVIGSKMDEEKLEKLFGL